MWAKQLYTRLPRTFAVQLLPSWGSISSLQQPTSPLLGLCIPHDTWRPGCVACPQQLCGVWSR